MMNRKTLFLTLISCALALPAHAFLTGDTVQMGHYFDSTLSSFGENPGIRTVEAGSGDEWSYAGLYTVNPEDSDFFINFNFTGTWSPGSAFNGIRISGIDEPFSFVDIDTNFAGWENTSRLTLTSGGLDANWSGLAWTEETYFNVHVNETSAVPEPPSLFLLFSSLVLVMLYSSRCLRKKVQVATARMASPK